MDAQPFTRVPAAIRRAALASATILVLAACQQAKDSATVLQLSLLYLPLLAGSVFLTVTQLWARMTMQRRWREWLNRFLIDRWL